MIYIVYTSEVVNIQDVHKSTIELEKQQLL